MKRSGPAVLCLLVTFAACSMSGVPAPTPTDPPPASTAGSTTTTTRIEVDLVRSELEGLDFSEFLDRAYQALLARSPQQITSLGLVDQLDAVNDQLDDLSEQYLLETEALERQVLAVLETYDRSQLSNDEQISYDTFLWHLDRQVRGQPFRLHDYPVHYFLTSYNTGLLRFLTDEHTIDDLADAEAYITRVGQIGQQVDQVIEGMEIRRQQGISPPDFVIDWTIATLREDLTGIASSPSAPRAEALPLFTTFVDRTAQLQLESSARQTLEDRLADGIDRAFVPAWQQLIDHLELIRPEAPAEVGVGRLPEGAAYYDYLLRHHTTTELSADEIHEMGLHHVTRVQGEMDEVFERLGYDTDLPLGTLRDRARRDGGFLDGSTPDQEAEVLAMFEELMAAARSSADSYFSSLPVGELAIVPEPVGRGGYYVPGASDGSRPGSYHAGIQGSGLPRYTMPTILYHETIPGHHHQITLAQELDLPDFRRFTIFTAFAEGWGLYAERLASEMGLYTNDPYGEIGRLELELLRAVRLVVDTGIHSRGWTRAEARAFMIEAMGDRSWTHEVERYISYPGQATSYLVGQQTILGLRDQISSRMGDRFDIVAFHDAVLGSGALPLDVLSTVVENAFPG